MVVMDKKVLNDVECDGGDGGGDDIALVIMIYKIFT